MEKPQKKRHNEALKVIAIITMLIDHVGLVFFPNIEEFRMIGRIAFPIFAYQLAIGYRFTSNKKKYLSRLWVFALISQIPYMLLFDTSNLNIMFTLLLSILVLDQVAKKRWYVIPLALLLIITPELFKGIPDFDYSWYGLLAPLLFYLFFHSKEKALLSQALLTIAYVFGDASWIQLFSIMGVFICLYFPQEKFKIHLNKYVFYWFYPLHLAFLFILIQIIH